MSRRRNIFLIFSVIGFLVLTGLSIYFESTEFLYAASAFPILIVLFLPDIEQNQFIRTASAKHKGITFLKQTIGGHPSLMIIFPPGFVRWNRKKLYFHFDQAIAAASASEQSKLRPLRESAALSVLPFDLNTHPRKKGWIGINLSQLAERTRNLSYTTEEVTRLSIPMSDLEETARGFYHPVGSKATGKSIQA